VNGPYKYDIVCNNGAYKHIQINIIKAEGGNKFRRNYDVCLFLTVAN